MPLIDSKEYEEAFGEDTVPYERYLTPAGMQLRMARPGTIREDIGKRVDTRKSPHALWSWVKFLLTETAPEVKFSC
jgi:phycobilisome core-membrane linker protein